MKLEDTIRTIPDFPKPGILFRDVTTLFKNPEAFHQLISNMAEDLKDKHVDVVVGPEAHLLTHWAQALCRRGSPVSFPAKR